MIVMLRTAKHLTQPWVGRLGWAQILRPTQDDKTEGLDNDLSILGHYHLYCCHAELTAKHLAKPRPG